MSLIEYSNAEMEKKFVRSGRVLQAREVSG